jgi:hypothetical protein
MHKGQRQVGDITCSSCGNEIGDASTVLCDHCLIMGREEAAKLILNDVVIRGPIGSGFLIGERG